MQLTHFFATVFLFSALPEVALAGTSCSKGDCGYVRNESPWELRVTKVENAHDDINGKAPKKTPHHCQFDNWNPLPPRAQKVWCYQITVPSGSSSGARNGEDDVDGLTFADRDWYFNGNKKTKGRWQKIWDGTKVRCYKNGKGEARCVDGVSCSEKYC